MIGAFLTSFLGSEPKMSTIDDFLDMFEIDWYLQKVEMHIGPEIHPLLLNNWHRKLFHRLQAKMRTYPCAAAITFMEEFEEMMKSSASKKEKSRRVAELRCRHLRREQERRRLMRPIGDAKEAMEQLVHFIFSGLTGGGQDPNQLLDLLQTPSPNMAISTEDTPLNLVTSEVKSPLALAPGALKLSQELQAQPFSAFQPLNFGPFPISQHLNAFAGGQPASKPPPKTRKRKTEEHQQGTYSTQMLQTLIARGTDPWLYQNWERLTPLQRQVIFQIGTGQLVPRHIVQLPMATLTGPPSQVTVQSSPSISPKTNFHSIGDMVEDKNPVIPKSPTLFSKFFSSSKRLSTEEFMASIMTPSHLSPPLKKSKFTNIPVLTIE